MPFPPDVPFPVDLLVFIQNVQRPETDCKRGKHIRRNPFPAAL
jgi:hypothetical protein